ncbi:ABC transporter ATP-binding protein [Acuticoccus sp. I52.16.1]|uniref:ABC transporter ATP-binding protein n=1 Tax=Acuticoccus sp. I52.16.1 TaxID=2928472 RepID=UPI001FD1DC57|nr:ABC transporter ATP-binding protein [Acuticoccus sp. I52.16.1]UOM35726.1 ABC transporter ATP-binding protein [Acuticoccus sp. I52.16.1]
MSAVLETRGLVKRFGGLAAVDGVDFHLASTGRLHAIIGPNGAGKTTFFNLVSGRLKPTEGAVFFRGRDITGMKPHRIARLGMTRTLQIKSVFGALTVSENIAIAAQAKDAGFHPFKPASRFTAVTEKVDRIIDQLGLDAIANRQAATLSYGDVALLEMGMALAADPELLLLDEPICGMSPLETKRTVETIVDLSKTVNVILIEHDMEVVFDIADDITVMSLGRILKQGTPAEIANDEDVREAYLGHDEDDDDDTPAAPMGAAHA